jgi:GAF domain-containing protein
MCVPHTNATCCDLRMPQGFYCVWPDQPADMLVVGPYQGSLGCLRIPFGKGVCGAAASSKQTQLVPDVHAFPGHIACASRWAAS